MTEPQEFDSIDELFRQTFKDMPETPAPNGWDAPSERVWEHVSAHMPTPKQGWTWRTWSMAGALVVVLALGLYWTYTSQLNTEPTYPAPVEAPVQQQPTATPADVDANGAASANIEITNAPAVVSPRSARGSARTNPVAPNHATSASAGDTVSEDPSVTQQRPAYPNNAERRRAEELRKRWNTAIPPLPTVTEKENRW